MLKIEKSQITKKDISKQINSKIGLSASYIDEVTNNLIFILKNLIKKKETKIKNFGSFRLIKKDERIGRNPKSKETYLIKARKSLSFRITRSFNAKINNL